MIINKEGGMRQMIGRYSVILLLLSLWLSAPLLAETGDIGLFLKKSEKKIPDVPTFEMNYKNEQLKCYPNALIKKKTRKNLVEYYCIKKNIATRFTGKDEISGMEQRGREETKRLRQSVKDKVNTGEILKVQIPLYDAQRPWLASYTAKQRLKGFYLGKYARWLLPAKFYISLRPQFAKALNEYGENKVKFQDAGSRAGFFYYYTFDNGIDLTLQYEGKIDWKNEASFINLSEQSNSTRRLQYLALDYKDYTLLGGKYWSAYYDIAGLTDYFMAFGAQTSGAFNNSGDGAGSGTGRPERMLQLHFGRGDFDNTVQFQFKHFGSGNLDSDYRYGVAASTYYKGWPDIAIGASAAYAKFESITPKMLALGIDGEDISFITGLSYKKDKFLLNGVLSYTKNHMNDDQGIYFDAWGAELYTRYDFTENIRIAGGINWLIPKDSDYQGQYRIKKTILSLQYTFGKRTFDDLIYLEIAQPEGRLANGDTHDMTVAIGFRYLLNL
jgi:hypothetical protein